MKYKLEELEKMSNRDLAKLYRNSKKSAKKDILKTLTNSRKFAVLMGELYNDELVEMAKIHPSKEVIVDTMISEMESHGTKMSIQKNFADMEKVLKHKSIFDKFKEKFSKKTALPESLPKKIEQVKKLILIENRRDNATGKKLENLEGKQLDQAVDNSRVEVNNGEMARTFERYANDAINEARKDGKDVSFFGTHGEKTDVAHKVMANLEEEYMEVLGKGKEDVAKLIAMKEFESYSGESLYIPYSSGSFEAKNYASLNGKFQISGPTDNRGWKKNLLEVEQVKDFTAKGHNFGEVFVVKSEFNPTSYAIDNKWAPIYEYYTKDENGEMIRIGSGKINKETGKMETTISIDGKDRSNDIRYDNEELAKAKEDETVIQFDSSEYTGESSNTSRKDIEQAITTKAIKNYLGNEKEIADITQVKDIPIVTYDEKGNPKTENAYVVASVEDGVESYEMVYIANDGKCKTYPGMKQDMFSKKEIYFPTGVATGYDKTKSLWELDKKQALEMFKSEDDTQFSAYRDENGVLRVAQMMEKENGNGKYAEELDTYSLVHGDMEKIKMKSKEKYDKELSLQKSRIKEIDDESKEMGL